MTKTENEIHFPFALDSIFRIKNEVYELLDRSQFWDFKNHKESFKYKMRKFDDVGTWFEVSHQQILNQDFEVVHRALFMRNKRKWIK
jgi:hypothetical protein